MAPRILEREHELRVIAAAAASAEAGCGSVLLVSGEAGIGKSRLVAATRAQLPPEGRLRSATVTTWRRHGRSARSAT